MWLRFRPCVVQPRPCRFDFFVEHPAWNLYALKGHMYRTGLHREVIMFISARRHHDTLSWFVASSTPEKSSSEPARRGMLLGPISRETDDFINCDESFQPMTDDEVRNLKRFAVVYYVVVAAIVAFGFIASWMR